MEDLKGIIGAAVVLVLLGIYIWSQKGTSNSEKTRKKKIWQEIEAYQPITKEALRNLEGLPRLLGHLQNTVYSLRGNSAYEELAERIWDISKESTRPLLVMVMGEFKTGKSTFINQLLGEPILKADAAPATAVTTLLRYGEKRSAILHYLDGREASYDYARLAEITAEGDDSKAALRESLSYVELIVPNELLQRINLIDTPGLNVHKESHIQNTEGFKEKADVVLWVFNAARSAARSEVQEIKALSERLKPFAIVNRIDNIDEEEESLEEVLANISHRLGDCVRGVYGVSAKWAQEASERQDDTLLARSQWMAFQDAFSAYLINRAEHLKERAVIEKTEGVIREFREEIQKIEQSVAQKEKLFAEEGSGREILQQQLQTIQEWASLTEICQHTIQESAQQYTENVYGRYGTDLFALEDDVVDVGNRLLGAINPLLELVDCEESENSLKGPQEFSIVKQDVGMLADKLREKEMDFVNWANDGKTVNVPPLIEVGAS